MFISIQCKNNFLLVYSLKIYYKKQGIQSKQYKLLSDSEREKKVLYLMFIGFAIVFKTFSERNALYILSFILSQLVHVIFSLKVLSKTHKHFKVHINK